MEENNMNDTYLEHSQHNEFVKDCSTCYSEARLLRAKTIVMREDLGTAIGHERSAISDPDFTRNPLE